MAAFTGKKVLVTGAAGFIGSHICEELLALGAHVVAVDNLSAGKKANLAFARDHASFRLVEKDICDDDREMAELFRGVDTVFHNAASKKSVCLANPRRDLEVNAGGTLNLLRHAVTEKVRKFVYASTGSVYGEAKIFPTAEVHPLDPVSYYGVSKLAAERYVDVFHRLHGLDTTSLRYFHVFGPRQESNEFGGVVSIFHRKILAGENPVVFGDGHQLRSFTWVKDVVAANLAAAVAPIATGQVYNVASGAKVTILELAKTMLELLDPARRLSIEFSNALVGDIRHFEVDNTKVREHLGVTFRVDFWETLRAALADPHGFT